MSTVARARHASSASSAKSGANSPHGAATAGSIQAITVKTNSRAGAAYTARAPTFVKRCRRRSATIGAATKSTTDADTDATAVVHALLAYDIASQIANTSSVAVAPIACGSSSSRAIATASRPTSTSSMKPNNSPALAPYAGTAARYTVNTN